MDFLVPQPRRAFQSFTDSLLWAVEALMSGSSTVQVFASAAQKVLSLVVALLGLTVVASYISLITNELSRVESASDIREARDLQPYRVGVMDDGTTAETFLKRYVPLLPKERRFHYSDTFAAVDALLRGEIDVYVNDIALMQYHLRSHPNDCSRTGEFYVLPNGEFLSQQALSIILPEGTDASFKEAVNKGLLKTIESDEWRAWLSEYGLDKRGAD